MNQQDQKISIREFARRVGVSDTAVHKAIKAGKISASCLDHSNPKRPKIFPDAALKEWGVNYVPNWEQSPALAAAIEKSETPVSTEARVLSVTHRSPKTKAVVEHSLSDDEHQLDENETVDSEKPDDESENIRLSKKASQKEAKRIREIADAKMAIVKLQEAKGKLVAREKVDKEFFDVGVSVRAAMQGIPDKWIDNILACDTRSEAHAMLYSAITEALEALHKENT